MKYRKGICVSDATEKELLRYQMEKIIKEGESMMAGSLGECSVAFAELYKSFEYRNRGRFIRIAIIFQFFICFLVLVVQLFGRKR